MKSNIFKSARIKLTLWYLGIIMFISVGFSIIVYTGIVSNAQRTLRQHERRVEARLQLSNEFRFLIPDEFNVEPYVDDIREQAIKTLAILNLGVLTISAILGYFLAGKTLSPIEDMVTKQKTFIADAAHEFKTPLASMKTALEVNLRDKKLKLSDARQVLEETVRSIDSLTLLVSSLISKSRYQQNNSISLFESIDIDKLLTSVLSKLDSKIKEKNLSVEYDNSDIKLFAQKESILELLTIILDNAIKFSYENGKIEIKINTEKDNVIIKVTDHGCGISKKDLPYVFDRFYKSDKSRTQSSVTGFGLGLSIAKDIVSIHKGNINIESALGKYTLVTITLPLKQG